MYLQEEDLSGEIINTEVTTSSAPIKEITNEKSRKEHRRWKDFVKTKRTKNVATMPYWQVQSSCSVL